MDDRSNKLSEAELRHKLITFINEMNEGQVRAFAQMLDDLATIQTQAEFAEYLRSRGLA